MPLRLRLSMMMFLLYAAPAAVQPVFSIWLEELGFDAVQTGFICATQALAALVVPLLVGQAADRWWPAERCLALCAALGAVVLLALSACTSPVAVFAGYLAFWSLQIPVMLLGSTVTFTHTPNPERDFGHIRVWGTVGWVVVGWLLGGYRWLTVSTSLIDAVRLGAVLSLVLAIYAATLPRTSPTPVTDKQPAPLVALGLLRDRAFGTYCLCVLLVSISYPFFQQVTPLLLQRLRISPGWLSPALTVGQALEIPTLILLPMLLAELGFRRTMLLGLGTWTIGLTAFAIGQPLWLVVLAESTWGVCISCFLIAGQVLLNRRAAPDVRASAQAMHFWMNGVGMLIGNPLVGCVRQLADDNFAFTFATALVVSCVSLGVFWLRFPADRGE